MNYYLKSLRRYCMWERLRGGSYEEYSTRALCSFYRRDHVVAQNIYLDEAGTRLVIKI